MKHKHRWQYKRTVEIPLMTVVGEKNKEFKQFKEWVEYAEFICECGKVRIVEVKR